MASTRPPPPARSSGPAAAGIISRSSRKTCSRWSGRTDLVALIARIALRSIRVTAFHSARLPELPPRLGRYGSGRLPGRVNSRLFAGEVFTAAGHFPLKCPITAPMHEVRHELPPRHFDKADFLLGARRAAGDVGHRARGAGGRRRLVGRRSLHRQPRLVEAAEGPAGNAARRERAFLNGPVDELCAMLDEWKIFWE